MFENIDWIMLIGQILGVVAVILGFVVLAVISVTHLPGKENA